MAMRDDMAARAAFAYQKLIRFLKEGYKKCPPIRLPILAQELRFAIRERDFHSAFVEPLLNSAWDCPASRDVYLQVIWIAPNLGLMDEDVEDIAALKREVEHVMRFGQSATPVRGYSKAAYEEHDLRLRADTVAVARAALRTCVSILERHGFRYYEAY